MDASIICYSCLCATPLLSSYFFFFNDTATTEIYTLSLHDALPISKHFDIAVLGRHHESGETGLARGFDGRARFDQAADRSEEHTSELQSRLHLVCRLLLEKKKKNL